VIDSFYARLATSNSYVGDQYFKSGRPWFDVVAFGADPSGAADSTPAFTAAILAATGSAAPATNGRVAKGPVWIPAGTYEITSDVLIQSVLGFNLRGAGPDATILHASGTGFTTAVVNIDGSLDGTYGGFSITGDGTEGAGSSGIPNALNLTFTTAAQRSTSANMIENIRVRNLNFVSGVSLAGIGTRQLDGTQLRNIVVTGGQTTGSWSSSGNWQAGFVFGNGSQGNIYDQVAYGCSAGLCYYGMYCNTSGFALWGSQPGGNAVDFWIQADAQVTIENVQSQSGGQFAVIPAGATPVPVSFRDCEFGGYTGTGYNPAWISVGTAYGSFIFENMKYFGNAPPTPPVIDLGSANYHAGFTLLNITQPNPPSSGIVPGSGGTPVVCLNYIDTTSGAGPLSTQYPVYAIGASMLYQQGTTRPAASTYGEMFFYNTSTGALSHSDGSSWTSFALTPAAPDIQVFTASGLWTKPTSPATPVTTEVVLVAPGGGGGSGRQGAVSTIRCGGGGGAGGQVLRKLFKTADLTSTVSVTVPGQQAGGAAQASADSNGSAGTGFANTVFGSFCAAQGGGPGGGGTALAGTAGSMFLGLSTLSGSGAAASTTGLAGVGVNTAGLTGPGGPSGGGITAANAAGNGAAGGNSAFGPSSGLGAAGVVDTTAPTSGTGTAINGSAGVSAGSGAASITTAAQAGADAALTGYGAGGAGGGASLDGSSSGAGGKGGPGFALVISYFQ
jgi:hypothetical protein